MLDALKQMLGKQYQPIAIALFVIVSLASLLAFGDSTLNTKIDTRITQSSAVVKAETALVEAHQEDVLKKHDQQIQLLQQSLTEIKMNLVEIKTDVKYLRERK